MFEGAHAASSAISLAVRVHDEVIFKETAWHVLLKFTAALS